MKKGIISLNWMYYFHLMHLIELLNWRQCAQRCCCWLKNISPTWEKENYYCVDLSFLYTIWASNTLTIEWREIFLNQTIEWKRSSQMNFQQFFQWPAMDERSSNEIRIGPNCCFFLLFLGINCVRNGINRFIKEVDLSETSFFSLEKN